MGKEKEQETTQIRRACARILKWFCHPHLTSDSAQMLSSAAPMSVWNLKRDHAVAGISNAPTEGKNRVPAETKLKEAGKSPLIVCAEVRRSYDEEIDSMVSAAKARCEKEDWG